MATTIKTIEDLMKVLDTHPEWLEAMRSRLLTRELLDLPQTLAQFVETTNRRLDQVDRQFKEVDQRFDQVDRQFKEVDQRFDGMDGRLDRMDRWADKTDRRLQRLEDRTGMLVGAHARDEAIKQIVLLPEALGLVKMRRLLGLTDLHALVRSNDTTGIPTNDLASFRRADAILEAEDDEGQTCYIAVEVSFTANGRDTSRAIRNAGYMTRFTGDRAYPAVIGVRVDQHVLDLVESGEVHWHRLDPKILEVE